jgi:uncharacterized membrane protein
MNTVTTVVATAALLGSALVGGVFFAFSNFVMKALTRLPSPEGIAAMQSINVVVLNPVFLGTFIGTAILSAGFLISVFVVAGHSAYPFFVGGALLYLMGTFLITLLGNVPLNDQLASLPENDPNAADMWALYLQKWLVWNHLRTVAALGGALLFIVGIIKLAAVPMR